MKKIFLSITLVIVFLAAKAQNFNMSSTSVTLDCATGGNLFDSGGPATNYGQSQNFVMTICPSNPVGFGISSSFISGSIGAGDFLCIFDGTTTADPLLACYNTANPVNTNDLIRSSVLNASGCLTFQFSSDGDGATGNFQLDLDCAPPCQEIIPSVPFADPTFNASNPRYIDVCYGDTVTLSAAGIYPQNNIAYNQSDATSIFYWDVGGVLDTGQIFSYVFQDEGFYNIGLQIEDINGCTNLNEIDLVIRQSSEFIANPIFDSIICVNETGILFNQATGDVVNGVIVIGDTVFTSNEFTVSSDALYIPDDSDPVSGNGITTPAVYQVAVSGFIPGSTITNGNQILEICLDIEHSFIGDLDIVLVAPNGTSMFLMNMAPPNGPASDFGTPVIGIDPNQPGVPATYCWSITAPNPALVVNAALPAQVTPGSYQASGNWNSFIGSPVNGVWQIQVFDDYGGDDGNIFGASFAFDQVFIPAPDTFVISYDAVGYWDADPTIISNLNQNQITIQPDTIGAFTYYYNTTNNFNCIVRDTVTIWSDGFEVRALPEDTIVCNDSVQLLGILVDVPLQCEPTYVVSAIPVNQITTGTPIAVTLTDESLSSNINIPFPFEFFCQSKPNFIISPNGFITFGTNNSFTPQNIPNINTPNDLIALFWTDLNPSTGGQIRHWVTGTAPNRIYIIEFRNVAHFGGTAGGNTVTGQIHLYETSNNIEIHCVNCMSDGGTKTIGIENNNGSVAYAAPGHNLTTPTVVNQAWRFAPENSLGNYVINWTPSSNISAIDILDPIVWPNTSTNYVISVTNLNNCTTRDTSIINVGGNFTYNVPPDTTICAGESVQLTVTGGALTYAWSPNDGSVSDTSIANPVFSPTSTTTYTVELDSFSCVTTETVTITVVDFSVDSTIVITESCAGAADASIEILTTGLVNPQFSIDGGVNFVSTNLFSNLASGTYDIVVNENSFCDTSYQVFIIGGAPLIIDSIALTNPLCGGINNGSIQVYISTGIAPYTYSINNGATEQATGLFSNLAGGTYTILVTDSFDCTVDSVVTLTQPLVLDINAIQIDSVSCFGGSDGAIELLGSDGTAPYTYSIDGITFTPLANFTGLSAGTYSLYVQDFNLCIDSADYDVEEPTDLLLSTSQVDVTCTGFSNGSASVTVLGGSPTYTYLWDDALAQTTATANNLVAGNYQVIVTDNNVCVDSIAFTISEPLDSLILSLDSIGNVLCNGGATGNIQVTTNGGTPGFDYLWSNGALTEDLNNVVDGSYTLTVTDNNGCQDVLTGTITEPNILNATFVNTQVSCFGANTGAVNVTPTGGVTPYQFSWIGPNGFTSTNEDISNLIAGVYNLVLTDANLCTFTSTLTLTQPTDIVLSSSQVNVTCKGLSNGSASVVANGGVTPYSYLWNDPNSQTTATANNLIAGTYEVIVTDNNLCLDSVTVVITEPADSLELNLVGITNILCSGENTGRIDVSTSGGTPNYTYVWTGGTTNEDLVNVVAGTYTLTVTDNKGCQDVLTASITQPTPLSLSLSGTSIDCFGNNTGAVNATISGGVSPYSFSWNGPAGFQAGTEDITNLIAGNYILNVTDDNACEISQSINITQPADVVIGFSIQNVNCFGGNDGRLTANIVSGGTAPFNFQWDANANNQTGATANGLIAGNYTVTVTDGNNCSYTSSATVTQPNIPLTLTMQSEDVTCFGSNNGSATVSAIGGTPAYTYLWNDPNSQTTAQANNLVVGTYQVIVTDANDCFEIDTVTISEPPVLSAAAIGDTTNCFGDATGAITAEGFGGLGNDYAYSIDGGLTFQSSPEFYNLPAGVYEVVVQDEASTVECISEPYIVTVFEQPFFSFEVAPSDTTLQLEESVTLELLVTSPFYNDSSISSVIWYPSTGLNCSDCIDPTVLTYESYTEYTATVYYQGDDNVLCSAMASSIIIVENNLQLFIPNAFTPGSFDNVNTVFEVYGEGIEFITMQIYNRWGEKIFESSNQRVSWDGTFQGVLQNPGVYTYFVDIEYLDGKKVDKKGSVTLIR